MPKISVIVPVYNSEKYIGKCLDSILNQTMQDFEIIVVDDGSTDESHEIICEYAEKWNDKIKCITQLNSGLAATRNIGVKNCSGEYISFIDADDYIEENLFTSMLIYINDGYDLIKFNLMKVDSTGKILQKEGSPKFEDKKGNIGFEILFTSEALIDPACIYLYKRKFYLENKFEFLEKTYHEDFGLIPIIINKAPKMVSTNYYGYYYLQTEDSITRTSDYSKTIQKFEDALTHYDNMINNLKDFEQRTRENLKIYYTNALILKLKELKTEEFKKYVRAIRERKMIANIKVRSIKQLMKRLVLGISIRLYLRMI